MSIRIKPEIPQVDQQSTLGKVIEKISDAADSCKSVVVDSVLGFAYFFGFGYSKEVDSYEQYNLKLIREAIVNRQTSQHRQQDGIFGLFLFVIRGDLEAFKEKLQTVEEEYLHIRGEPIENSPIFATDAAGGTIIHIAYLYQQYDIGRFLVNRYPKLGLRPYRGTLSSEIRDAHAGKLGTFTKNAKEESELMPYSGENILHMAIVRRSYSEVRWLLDFYRDHKDFYCPNIDDHVDPDNLEIVRSTSRVSNSKVQPQDSLPPPAPQVMTLKALSGIPLSEQTKLHHPLNNHSSHTGAHRAGGSSNEVKRTYVDGLAWLLGANAHGTFFDNKGDFYFGAYPLQFAVCSNDTEIFDLVFAFVTMLDNTSNDAETGGGERATGVSSSKSLSMSRNAIFKRDCYGNTVLHLCVLHGLKEMYGHVYNTALTIVTKELRLFYASLKGKDVGKSKTLPSDKEDEDEEVYGYAYKTRKIIIPTPSKVKLWLKDEAKRIVDERLVLALNEELHSPLTLAAALIRKNKEPKEVTDSRVAMFEYLLGHMQQPLWSFGPVSFALLDVAGVEIKYQLQRDYKVDNRLDKLMNIEHHAAIDWLCINDADTAIQIPMVRKLIETKWERVGYPMFLVGFFIHLLVTILVTLILIFVNATPTTKPGYSTEWIVNFLYPIVSLMFFVMFVMEINDFVVFNAHYLKFRGVARFNKVARGIKVLAFVAFCCCKVVQANLGIKDEDNSVNGATVYFDSNVNVGVKFSLTVCVVASWMHLYFFFMGFNSTGPFVLTIFRIIAKDVPYFITFYSIVVIAFGCALSALSNNGSYQIEYGFLHLLKAIWTLIQNTVGADSTHDEISVNEFVPLNLRWWADILYSVYIASVAILMLNLLIAMISATYELYVSYNEAILLIEKYNIMHAMEKAMSTNELEDYRKHYHANIMQPDPSDVYGEQKSYAGPAAAEGEVNAAAGKGGVASIGGNVPARLSKQMSVASIHADDANPLENIMQNKFEVQSVNSSWWEKDQINSAEECTKSIEGYLNGSKKTTLFIIDPQIDFHPAGGGEEGDPMYHPNGSLAVPGANEDTHRIAEMIDLYGAYIHDIFVSMDSHYPCHIAHAESWRNKAGEKPAPFTLISYNDVRNGTWVPVDDSKENMEWVLYYTSTLERKKKMKLVIWPEHCIIGTRGHSLVPELNAALQRWAEKQQRVVNYVMKGQNLRTEMYSALEAEVEDPADPSTSLNGTLVAILKVADRLLICGQALSHCVNYTMRDIMAHWDDAMSDLVVLKDAASPVTGFEEAGEEFKSNCLERGVTVCKIEDVFSKASGYEAAPLCKEAIELEKREQELRAKELPPAKLSGTSKGDASEEKDSSSIDSIYA